MINAVKFLSQQENLLASEFVKKKKNFNSVSYVPESLQLITQTSLSKQTTTTVGLRKQNLLFSTIHLPILPILFL